MNVKIFTATFNPCNSGSKCSRGVVVMSLTFHIYTHTHFSNRKSLIDIRGERDVLPVLQEGGRKASAHLPVCLPLPIWVLLVCTRSSAAVCSTRPACLSKGKEKGQKKESEGGVRGGGGGGVEAREKRKKRKREE